MLREFRTSQVVETSARRAETIVGYYGQVFKSFDFVGHFDREGAWNNNKIIVLKSEHFRKKSLDDVALSFFAFYYYDFYSVLVHAEWK